MQQKVEPKEEFKIGKMDQKKVLAILAFRDFRDVEFFQPESILKEAGIEVKVASDKKGTAIGADGGEVEVDYLIDEVDVDEFDGIFFVGGPGCLKHLDKKESYSIAQKAKEKNKVLGAICIAPVILAKAGILKGKKATVWTSTLDKSPAKILKENGAQYLQEKVVVDGKIVTANGPQAAEEFGKKLLEIL
jgi:protease I